MSKSNNVRTIASQRRDSDAHTATGRRVREHRPDRRRTGTRAAAVRLAVREG